MIACPNTDNWWEDFKSSLPKLPFPEPGCMSRSWILKEGVAIDQTRLYKMPSANTPCVIRKGTVVTLWRTDKGLNISWYIVRNRGEYSVSQPYKYIYKQL